MYMKEMEEVLSQNMSTLSEYLQTWRLKLNKTKTVTSAFHLNNREAKRKLKVDISSKLFPFFHVPTYLGVKLERTLRYTLKHCTKNYLRPSYCYDDLRPRAGRLVLKPCAKPPYPSLLYSGVLCTSLVSQCTHSSY